MLDYKHEMSAPFTMKSVLCSIDIIYHFQMRASMDVSKNNILVNYIIHSMRFQSINWYTAFWWVVRAWRRYDRVVRLLLEGVANDTPLSTMSVG